MDSLILVTLVVIVTFAVAAAAFTGGVKVGRHIDNVVDESADTQARHLETFVRPLADELHRFDDRMQTIERERAGAYGALRETVRAVADGQRALADETKNLTSALRSPTVRGRWGELSLKRVVELAGMVEHCDFDGQVTVGTGDGHLRPDLVVRIPGNARVVVDAKAPLEAYLEAMNAADEDTRRIHMDNHARHVRGHMQRLAQKSYWAQFGAESPEFVVLYMPGDAFYAAALEADPTLIEAGAVNRVILATPTTLIALLRSVAHGWRQASLAANAQAVSEIGRELYGRVAKFADHLAKTGAHLGRSVKAYNEAVGSLESRVLVSMRKLHDLGAGESAEIELPPPVELHPRELSAAELRDSDAVNL
ncbi:MAG: DNA recombination protein RmuC [Acidimicrobiia bacterium]|nr:DNA recombination protein RmuC [Acidimicrobiia bacterium]